MKAYLLLVMLLPNPVQASTTCPVKLEERIFLCTPSQAEQDEIIDYARKGTEAQAKIKDAREAEEGLRLVAAQANEKTEAGFLALKAWYEKDDERQEAEDSAQINLNLAMERTRDYYGIAPQKRTGTVTNGPLKGKSVGWTLKYYDDEAHFRRVADPKDPSKMHYLGLLKNIKGKIALGVTKYDGEVAIRLSAFLAAAGSTEDGVPANAGRLAATLYHETIHYDLLVGKGWTSKQEMELAAHQGVLDQAEALGLDEDRITEIEGIRDDFQEEVDKMKLEPKLKISPFPTTKEEAYWKQSFELEEAAETLREDIAKERTSLLARYVTARQERQAAEERRKQAEAAAAEHQRLIDEYKSWVKRHGFAPLMTSDGLYAVGFGKHQGPQYYFTEASTTLDHARMGLFFSFACAAGRIDDTPNNQAVLGEIIGVINRRWSEPGFKSRLELEVSDGAEEECLRHMRDSLRLPISLKSVDQAATRYWKDWNNSALRRKKESERAQKRQQEEDYRRQRQQDREGRGTSGGDHHTDLTPAQNALDKARREGLP